MTEVSFARIRAALREAGVREPIIVEQTGGNVATIFIGAMTDIEYCEAMRGPDQHYAVAIGPGAYNWRDHDFSTFWLGSGDDADLSVGPDDHGDSPDTLVGSLPALTAAVTRLLGAPR